MLTRRDGLGVHGQLYRFARWGYRRSVAERRESFTLALIEEFENLSAKPIAPR